MVIDSPIIELMANTVSVFFVTNTMPIKVINGGCY